MEKSMSPVTAAFPAYHSQVVAYSAAAPQPDFPAGMRELLDAELAAVYGSGFWSFVSKVLIIGGAAALLGGIAAGAFFLAGGFGVDDWWQDYLS
jgi:hypothetical protein